MRASSSWRRLRSAGSLVFGQAIGKLEEAIVLGLT